MRQIILAIVLLITSFTSIYAFDGSDVPTVMEDYFGIETKEKVQATWSPDSFRIQVPENKMYDNCTYEGVVDYRGHGVLLNIGKNDIGSNVIVDMYDKPNGKIIGTKFSLDAMYTIGVENVPDTYFKDLFVRGGGDLAIPVAFYCGREDGFIKLGNFWIQEENYRETNIITMRDYLYQFGAAAFVHTEAEVVNDEGKITILEPGSHFKVSNNCKDEKCFVEYWHKGNYSPICYTDHEADGKGWLEVVDKSGNYLYDFLEENVGVYKCWFEMQENVNIIGLEKDFKGLSKLERGDVFAGDCTANICRVFYSSTIKYDKPFAKFNSLQNGKRAVKLFYPEELPKKGFKGDPYLDYDKYIMNKYDCSDCKLEYKRSLR